MRRITIALLALIVVMGCEQATDGKFEGLLSGDRATSGWLPPPSVERQSNTIVLTWTPSNGSSYQSIYRKSSTDDAYFAIGMIVDRADHALPDGPCTFTDYFTDPNKTYVYYTGGGYFMPDVGDWDIYDTKDSAPIQGAGSIQVPTSVQGSSDVTFDDITGVLTFNPALPTFDNHAKAGRGKTLLEFDQDISSSPQIREMGIESVTVQELPFEWSFEYANTELSLYYTPVYEKYVGTVSTLVYIPHEYELTGDVENIMVPRRPIDPPDQVSAAARGDGSIALSWFAGEGA
ncbi:MAG: hypothetical protein LBS86_03625, partial [Treponema sp.]|nr:hypothetical protein [Treponema sp.]